MHIATRGSLVSHIHRFDDPKPKALAHTRNWLTAQDFHADGDNYGVGEGHGHPVGGSLLLAQADNTAIALGDAAVFRAILSSGQAGLCRQTW